MFLIIELTFIIVFFISCSHIFAIRDILWAVRRSAGTATAPADRPNGKFFFGSARRIFITFVSALFVRRGLFSLFSRRPVPWIFAPLPERREEERERERNK